MFKRVFKTDVLQIFRLPVSEGPAASSEHDTPEASRGGALQALENGRVLRVRGSHADTKLLDQRDNDGAASNQRLLIRERNILARPHRSNGGKQARAPDNACDDDVGVAGGGGLGAPGGPASAFVSGEASARAA